MVVVVVVVFQQILFTLSSGSQNSPSALLLETTQRPPAGSSAEQLYLGSPLSRLSTSLVSLCHPNVSATGCKSQSQTASQG